VIRIAVLWAGLLIISTQLAAQGVSAEVSTVPHVDLSRYAGTWYEVAAIPQFFQRKCIRNTSAEYVLGADGLVQVTNRCDTDSDGTLIANGRARIVDATTNAKLEVTFLKLFGDWRFWAGGDYWVIGLDDGYRWAIVGHPTRKYAWVLSRTAALPDADWARVDAVLNTNGYDRCSLLLSPQSEGLSIKKPLCER
jgi:apolipoprotein D and lipocalin family protein